MTLDEWAKRWGVYPEAMEELKKIFFYEDTEPNVPEEKSESTVQARVRLEASQKGCRLWRNNVGAGYMLDGSFLRFGLANDSSALNKSIKSADLIGIRPVLIEQRHVGTTIGQFLSREIKASTWKYRGTTREKAQLKWAELVVSLGGDACITAKEGTL